MATSPTSPSPDHPHATLFHNRRLLVALIACGVVAFVVVACIQFSGAAFTSSSRSPGNEFSAAMMGLELSEHGPVVDGDDLHPGDVRSGSQTVTNTGHQGDLLLEVRGLDGSALLARTLQVTVQQTDPPTGYALYEGPLSDLDEVVLGTLYANEDRTYSITVAWPADATAGALLGSSVSLDFAWRIESLS